MSERRIERFSSIHKSKQEFNFTTTEIDSIIGSLKPYRIEANAKTHSIVEFGKKEDLEKYDVQNTFNLLERLWNN